MSGNITTVIFDLGNVLIDFDHTIAANKIKQFSNKSKQEIYELIFDSELIGIFEEGKISPQEFFFKIKQLLGLKIEYDKFLPIWNDIFFLTKENQAVYNLAQRLKERYKIAVLSNINILHLDYLKTNFSFLYAFQSIIASCELGVRKPQKAIYNRTLGILKASGDNVFYTDDRPELIKAARQLGINSFIFQGLQQLKKDLSDLRVNINYA